MIQQYKQSLLQVSCCHSSHCHQYLASFDCDLYVCMWCESWPSYILMCFSADVKLQYQSCTSLWFLILVRGRRALQHSPGENMTRSAGNAIYQTHSYKCKPFQGSNDATRSAGNALKQTHFHRCKPFQGSNDWNTNVSN